jgi:hypothetical protein
MPHRNSFRTLATALAASLLTASLAACASAQKKFESITPGMSQDDVRRTMGEGPSRFRQLPDAQYSSWYWGDDYCVLFKQDHVVSKDSTESGRNVSVGPGKYEEKRKAACLAPGQVVTESTERTVEIPGVGSIHLPQGKLAPSPEPRPRTGERSGVAAPYPDAPVGPPAP